MAYPGQTITPKLGLSLIGQDEVIAENFSLIDAAFSGSVVNAVGISGGNTLGATGSSTGSVYFQGGNNITLSGTGSTIVIVGGAGGGGGNFSAGVSGGNTLGTSGTVSNQIVFAGGNNVTLSGSTNAGGISVTISGPNTVAQSVQTQGSVLINGSSGSIVLTAGNNITLSQNASTITVSAANQTVQTQGSVLINGSSGSIVFTAGNNITLSQSASTITISASNQSVQTQNCVDISLAGNSTSAGGGFALISSGTAIFAGGNNITLSQNGQGVTISGGAATNSFMVLNSVLTVALSNAANGNVFPVFMQNWLSISQANAMVSINMASSATNNSSMGLTLSASLIVFTRSGSTLASVSSGSASFGYASLTSNQSTDSISGLRAFSVPINAIFTPGDYWLNFNTSLSTSGNLAGSCSVVFASVNTMLFSGGLGGNAAASAAVVPGWGHYTIANSSSSFTLGGTASASANRLDPYLVLMNFSA
jgi:autotransporter family porin